MPSNGDACFTKLKEAPAGCQNHSRSLPTESYITTSTLSAQGVRTLQHSRSYKRLKRKDFFSAVPVYLPYFKRIDKHIKEARLLHTISSSMPSMLSPALTEFKNTLSHSASDIEQFSLDEVNSYVHMRNKEWRNLNLNDLEFVQLIGTGMYSRVHLVQTKVSKDFFALKVMPKYKTIKKRSSIPLKTEAEIMLSLDHPLVVKTWNTFEDEKNFYMLMDFAAGGELFYHLRNAGRFDEDTARFYAAEVVLALEYLHSNNVAYRDLKLENLVLSPEGHIQLTDFGFAKYMSDSRTFTLCGTPEYLAPEIIRGTGYGLSVDWWSLGVLIFEMLAGYSPFYNENPLDIYKSILRGSVRFSSCMSETAVDLLKGLLSRDVSQRLGTVRDGVSELRDHPFFAGVDWSNHHLKVPPIIPAIKTQGDTKYFEIDEPEEHTGADVTDDSNSSSSEEEGSEVEELFNEF